LCNYNFSLYICILLHTYNYFIMFRINLHPIFAARGIDRPYTFLVKAGFTPHSASVILKNPKEIKLRYIELLCINLNCEPSDLFMWSPDKNHPVAENHPLHNLSTASTTETLLNLPYKQLKEIASKLTTQAKEGEVQ
jgi:DNA-binding Xre family transcriptional regulator